MTELQGTLIERLEQAVNMICSEVTNEEIAHFYEIYEKAGIKPSLSAVEFFKKYGGAYRDNYIMLPNPKHNTDIFLKCYGKYEDGDLKYAAQYLDMIKEMAKQDVCPIALIGYQEPADVFIGENGLLYCMYEFKEEIDVFNTPAEILEYYLRNEVPIGVDRKPIKKSYDGRTTKV